MCYNIRTHQFVCRIHDGSTALGLPLVPFLISHEWRDTNMSFSNSQTPFLLHINSSFASSLSQLANTQRFIWLYRIVYCSLQKVIREWFSCFYANKQDAYNIYIVNDSHHISKYIKDGIETRLWLVPRVGNLVNRTTFNIMWHKCTDHVNSL